MSILDMLTRPLPDSPLLGRILIAASVVLPWLVAAWPTIPATMLAVYLARRASGKRYHFTDNDILPTVLTAGMALWVAGLWWFSKV